MEYNVDIYDGKEKVFTLYNIHQKKSENDLVLFELKKRTVVEFFQQSSFFRILSSLKKICEDFDVQVNSDFFCSDNEAYIKDISVFTFEIIIKYSEINITNSRSQKACLKDFFVKIYMNLNKRNLIWISESYLYGLRSTMYDYEVYSGYIHSHLPSRQKRVPEFNTFCLGDGPIKLVLIELNNATKFNFIKFEGLLYQIRNYLSWESIEGGPHIRLQNRNQLNNSSIVYHFYCFNYGYSQEEKFLTKIINKNIELFLQYVKISFSPYKKDIIVDVVGSDEQKILETYEYLIDNKIINANVNKEHLFVFKTMDGYCNFNTSSKVFTSSELKNKIMFKFKNDNIRFNVLSKEDEYFNPKKVFNPIFKNKVLNFIKYLIKLKIKNDSDKNKRLSSAEKETGYYRIKEQEDTSIYIR